MPALCRGSSELHMNLQEVMVGKLNGEDSVEILVKGGPDFKLFQPIDF